MAERGVRISRETARRHIDALRDERPPDPAIAPVVAAADQALEGGELEALRRRAVQVDQALDEWAPSLGRNPTGARTFATLARIRGDLARAITDLLPRADLERSRLEELGVQARAELLERCRAAARSDDITALRLRISAQAVLLESANAKLAELGLGRGQGSARR